MAPPEAFSRTVKIDSDNVDRATNVGWLILDLELDERHEVIRDRIQINSGGGVAARCFMMASFWPKK